MAPTKRAAARRTSSSLHRHGLAPQHRPVGVEGVGGHAEHGHRPVDLGQVLHEAQQAGGPAQARAPAGRWPWGPGCRRGPGAAPPAGGGSGPPRRGRSSPRACPPGGSRQPWTCSRTARHHRVQVAAGVEPGGVVVPPAAVPGGDGSHVHPAPGAQRHLPAPRHLLDQGGHLGFPGDPQVVDEQVEVLRPDAGGRGVGGVQDAPQEAVLQPGPAQHRRGHLQVAEGAPLVQALPDLLGAGPGGHEARRPPAAPRGRWRSTGSGRCPTRCRPAAPWPSPRRAASPGGG